MIILEMSREDCLQLLSKVRLSRLACASENQPYIVPVFLVYRQSSTAGPCFYGFTTFGQKIAWMRANPQVCVEVDQVVSHDQWLSVIAVGRYEELPGSPRNRDNEARLPEQSESRSEQRNLQDSSDMEAWEILNSYPSWQEPGSTAGAARGGGGTPDRLKPVFYRIRIDSVTGHEATRELKDKISSAMPASLLVAGESGPSVPSELLHVTR